jgi:outer membrane protein OmpA-like peptidoglycan-associated protein
MKTPTRLLLTGIALAALGACNSLPADNAQLMGANRDFRAAQNNPAVSTMAPNELKRAETSLNAANSAWSNRAPEAEINHLSYLATQSVAIAQETALQKSSELIVANAEAQRNSSLLAARTAEADNAMRTADQAQRNANLSKMQSDASERDAAAARNTSMASQAYAAQLESRLAAMDAKSTDRGYVITIGDLLFDTNRAELKSNASNNVDKLSDFLKQYPQRNVVVEGYTDSTGSQELNQELSERRANAVRTALIGSGINSNRIATRGYAESYPVNSNASAQGRQLNRRVEIVLSDENGKNVSR